MTSSTTASMAPVSDTCFMPRASTMASGSLSSSMMAANTSLACFEEIVSSASIFTSESARTAVSGVSASNVPSWAFSHAATSLMMRFASGLANLLPSASAFASAMHSSKKSAVARCSTR